MFELGCSARSDVDRFRYGETRGQGTFYSGTGFLAFSRGAGLGLGLLVVLSWLSHELVGFRAAFKHARFDAAGAIPHFVTGNLPEVVFAQLLHPASDSRY